MRREFSGLAAALCGLLAVPAGELRAETPQPFADFTFKSVKPPKKNDGSKRITIRVTPEDMARQNPRLAGKDAAGAEADQATAAQPDAAAVPKPRDEAYAWFWETVSPAMESSV